MPPECKDCGGKIIPEEEMAELDRKSKEACGVKPASAPYDYYDERHRFYEGICVCNHPEQDEVDGLY